MQTVKSAVVGLGIGMAHVAGYLASPHATLVAVADAWKERRERIGGTFAQGSMAGLRPLFDEADLDRRWEDLDLRVYDDVAAVIADPEIQLVSLCTPDDTHEEFAVRLLDAGKHLLLEKPMALSISGARRIADAAERTGRRVAMGYEMRINPAVARVKNLVSSGEIGAVQGFNLQQHRRAFRRDKWQKWIQDRDRSGGLVVEETCHWFDLARYLTGKEVRTVHCVGNDRVHPDFNYEDIAFVQGCYDDGAVFQIGHSLTGFDFSLVIQVYGTRGAAWCGLKSGPVSLLDAGQTSYVGVVSWGPVDEAAGPGQTVTFGDEAREGDNIRDHVQHVAEALLNGSPLLADHDDGIRSLEIALAARRSMETGEVEEL